jgi:hypothetical protein
LTEFFASLREFRRPIALIAVGFVLLTGLLAGLAGAQAAARFASGDLAVFCHGAPDGGATPADSTNATHDCCAVCTTSWPLSDGARATARIERLDVVVTPPVVTVDAIAPIAPRAVRAGPSQAPPISV